MKFAPLSPDVILKGHRKPICGIAWCPDGSLIASASKDKSVRVWEPASASCRCTLKEHRDEVVGVAWSPSGDLLASAGKDARVLVWDYRNEAVVAEFAGHSAAVRAVDWSPDGETLATGSDDHAIHIWNHRTGVATGLSGHNDWVRTVSFSKDGRLLLSGSDDKTIAIWDVASAKISNRFRGHKSWVHNATWSPDEQLIASSSEDCTVRIWNVASGKCVVVLEAHTAPTSALSFSPDGTILVSKSEDGTVLAWDTGEWDVMCSIEEALGGIGASLYAGVAFHPTGSRLATLDKGDRAIRIWRTESIRNASHPEDGGRTERMVTARIALLGDGHVGKTTLGHRLLTGTFKVFHPTHGQHFWILPSLSKHSEDGLDCQAILWDFAGQPDYRLINSLFLDDIQVALVLFNASDRGDPLRGARFWLGALRQTRSSLHSVLLVATQMDLGGTSLTPSEIDQFCERSEIAGGFVATSSNTGEGIDELESRLRDAISWQDIPTTVSTRAFSCTRDAVMEARSGETVFLRPSTLKKAMAERWKSWTFDEEEVDTALKHLENHGVVALLPDSPGDMTILLAPELLTSLASSIVLAARRSSNGLGSILESDVYNTLEFPEVTNLDAKDRHVLLNAAVALFLRRNLCFCEPVGADQLLVFPALINESRPSIAIEESRQGPTYLVVGSVEQIFSIIVVLLGYTNTFKRVSHWRDQAEYTFTSGDLVGIKKVDRSDGEVSLALYYGFETADHCAKLFESLFESFLYPRNAEVLKIPVSSCANCGHTISTDVLEEWLQAQKTFVFCVSCGQRIELPSYGDNRPDPDRESVAAVANNRRSANNRTHFAEALSYVRGYQRQEGITKTPKCFISYAWGDPEHEEWVGALEAELSDVQIETVLDQHDSHVGMDLADFIVEGVSGSDFVVVVGTRNYRDKYQNKSPNRGSVVAAEVDLINQRLMGPRPARMSVLPLLLQGEPDDVLPPLLQGRVFCDFRESDRYLSSLLDLILTIHGCSPSDEAFRVIRRNLNKRLLRN